LQHLKWLNGANTLFAMYPCTNVINAKFNRGGSLMSSGRRADDWADDWVSACRKLEVANSRGKHRPRMIMKSTVGWRIGDMKNTGMRPGMAMNQEK